MVKRKAIGFGSYTSPHPPSSASRYTCTGQKDTLQRRKQSLWIPIDGACSPIRLGLRDGNLFNTLCHAIDSSAISVCCCWCSTIGAGVWRTLGQQSTARLPASSPSASGRWTSGLGGSCLCVWCRWLLAFGGRDCGSWDSSWGSSTRTSSGRLGRRRLLPVTPRSPRHISQRLLLVCLDLLLLRLFLCCPLSTLLLQALLDLTFSLCVVNGACVTKGARFGSSGRRVGCTFDTICVGGF